MALLLPEDHRFHVVRRLGAGGMGVVYEVEDRVHRRRCALKTLRATDGQALCRLKSEFRQLQDIAHPNLVRIEGLVQQEDLFLLVMELVDGEHFFDAVRARKEARWSRRSRGAGPVPQDAVPCDPGASSFAAFVSSDDLTLVRAEVVEASAAPHPEAFDAPPVARIPCPSDPEALRGALRQLVSALVALHRAGKVHCDIKPSNVLITEEGRLVLLDFGLLLAEDAGRTLDGSILGTPVYMSPEQCVGETLTPASDWYSVGAMLYEALAGRAPHEGTLVGILSGKRTRDPDPPSRFAEEVPADLEAICLALLARDPCARPDGAAILARLGDHSPGPPAWSPQATSRGCFVGRERELAVLDVALAEAREGRARIVHVRGPAGLGKTALIEQWLRTHELVVLRGRCYERETLWLEAWDALIDDLSRLLRRLAPADAAAVLPVHVASLAQLFPVLGRVVAIQRLLAESPRAYDPDAIRRRALGAFAELLARLSARAPVVLFVDDLHFGDRESVLLLRELLASGVPASVVVVLAYRDESIERSPCLRELLEGAEGVGGVDCVRVVDVGPLGAADMEELAHRLVGAERVGANRIAARIARESMGSPLFAAELARALAADDASRPAQPASPPDTTRFSLHAMVARRLVAIADDARSVLEIVCVALEPLSVEVVGLASGLEGATSDALTVLERERFVRCSGGDPDDVVEPLHDAIRHAVVEALPLGTRRRLELAIADALLASSSPQRQLSARHRAAAERPG